MSFDVDPDNLRTSGAAIENVHAGAAGDLGRSHRETESGGSAPWGTGLYTNAMIGILYAELTSLTGEAIDLVGGGLEHSGSGARSMGEEYERVDNEAGEGFRRIEGGCRGSA